MTSFVTPRQRGIYSEIVNPENASQIKNDISKGPSNSLAIHVNERQRPPKAFSIHNRMKIKQGSRIFKEHNEIMSVDPKVRYLNYFFLILLGNGAL